MPNDLIKKERDENEQNKQNKQDLQLDEARFWELHPLGRGLRTGVICALLRDGFKTGFTYGALSGIANIAVRPIVKEPIQKIQNPEAKAAASIAARALPWATSYGLIRLFPSSLTLSRRAAIVGALACETLGNANDYLEEPKPKKTCFRY